MGLELTKTIVLVGLMGAGKTTVGRRLAKQLGARFADSDDEVVEAAGCSIRDIFEIHGEPIFRDLEQRVIARMLTQKTPCVIATGGGAWMNPQIREDVKQHAVSLWLKADIDVLLERVSRRNTRPLLEKGDKRATLQKLMDERYPIYASAELTVESDSGAQEKVVGSILSVLNKKKLLQGEG